MTETLTEVRRPGLSREQLLEQVPAAFASAPSSKVSDRYAFISTSEIIDELEERGWSPVRATQNRRGDLLHGTHRINFRQPDLNYREVGDVIPEIGLINNHGGIRKAELFAAMFKLACSNGMVVATGMETRAVVIHRGDDAVIEVDEALNETVTVLGAASNQIRDWREIELSLLERREFADRAGLIRTGGDANFNGRALLQKRRFDDERNDLWTTLNVVQENIIRGGVHLMSNRRRTRGITNVAEDQRINESLWTLASDFATEIRDRQSRS